VILNEEEEKSFEYVWLLKYAVNQFIFNTTSIKFIVKFGDLPCEVEKRLFGEWLEDLSEHYCTVQE
jgi:hypothetical protein